MAEVLIVGPIGGREHAAGDALRDGDANSLTFTNGGNAGTAEIGTNINGLYDADKIVDYARNRRPGLTFIGPEAPLVAGLADRLRDAGVTTFGPGADGARLESSKAYTAEFLRRYGIRQPGFTVASDVTSAAGYMANHEPAEYVIKADGLAGGKGVILPQSRQEAADTASAMLRGELFKGAGDTIVFQDRLNPAGAEVSAFFMLDGKNFTLLPLSQDHKRLNDGDEGPNTGGMGAYTPLPFENDMLVDELLNMGEELVYGLQKEDIDYRGLAYLGTMMDVENDNKPSVLEINVRFGDPETQVVLAGLGRMGINSYDLMKSAAEGSLPEEVRGEYLGQQAGIAALTVCLAAGGYPDSPRKDDKIYGLHRGYDGVEIYHGGTKLLADGDVVTSGGRVLYVTATGETVDEAADRAYAAIGPHAVHFAGMQYRHDIGWQARTAA